MRGTRCCQRDCSRSAGWVLWSEKPLAEWWTGHPTRVSTLEADIMDNSDASLETLQSIFVRNSES